MKWIKLTEENKPDRNTKIAFMTSHILFPDNTFFGIMGGSTDNFYSKGEVFEKDMVTHYFYVEPYSESFKCQKCKDTGVIWSDDKMSARSCGCK